jgi:CheY-like chemotaxis protein
MFAGGRMSHKRTILLVESETAIARARAKALEGYGYRVIIAATGGDAVERVRSDGGIDLVVAGVDPDGGMNGPEAVEAILSERDMPVLFYFQPTSPGQNIPGRTRDPVCYGYAIADTGEARLQAAVQTALELHGRAARQGLGHGGDWRGWPGEIPGLMDQASDASSLPM